MPSAEGAIESLYEDADVRDELRDDEANTLLKWAEDRLNQLAAQSATDDEFDAKAAQFRNLLKGMNRLVGNRATLDAAALDTRLNDLSTQAASVATGGQPTAQAAPSIPADQLKAVAGKLPSLDDAGAVNALTALFTPNVLTPSSSPSGQGQKDKPQDRPAPVAPAASNAPAEVPAIQSAAPAPAPPVAPKSDAAPTPKAAGPTAQSAPTEQAQPMRGKANGPNLAPVSQAVPAPQAAPAPASANEDDGGFLHRFSIHFWHSRKKTPPQ